MTSSSNAPIALLGGTFDPIHRGHTQPALSLADAFGWQRIHLQPCYTPPHRPPPEASDEQRWTMTQLAAQDDPRLLADDFELRQAKPTRTVHTLTHLRQTEPHTSINFIMGMDSFLSFTNWLNWEDILKLAHLIVLQRPGYSLSDANPELTALLKTRRRDQTDDFATGAGLVYIADSPPYDISATELRRQLRDSNNCPSFLSPLVFQYIRAQGLYR
ncbi:nicotinate-nucleotide adenylyltransferase [Aliidiomarina sp. Khilg15.8]